MSQRWSRTFISTFLRLSSPTVLTILMAPVCHPSSRHSASCCLINDIYVTGKLLLSANHRICKSVLLTDPRAPRQIEGRARCSTWAPCLNVSPRHLGLGASRQDPLFPFGWSKKNAGADPQPPLHIPAGRRCSEDGGEPWGCFIKSKSEEAAAQPDFFHFGKHQSVTSLCLITRVITTLVN